jgi:hypothetical protein
MSDPTASDSPAVYETTRCPRGPRCEMCGADAVGLTVVTRTTALGVICLTACPRCAAADVEPPITVRTARNFADQHRQHVGGAR